MSAPSARISKPAPTTEDFVALRLAEREAGRLRFCHDARAWFAWDGTAWRRDRAGVTVQKIREVIRGEVQAQPDEVRAGPGSMRFVGGVERLARHDPALAVTASDWDGDPLWLGTPGGTVLLDSGDITESDPRAGIRHTTAVAPAEIAACPLWLARITALAGSASVVRFLQQVFGAATSGIGDERVIVCCKDPRGAGAEGLMRTVADLLGDYASATSLARVAAADPASLHGLRMILACERGPRRAWPRAIGELFAEPDRVAIGHRRVLPTAKLFVVAAETPDLSRLHPAARARVYIVPFDGPRAVPDRDYEAELARERPSILRWILYGCVAWRAQGLALAPGVLDATAGVLEERDVLGQFLQDACDCEPGDGRRTASAGPLFAAWALYSQSSGERTGSPREFAEALEARGFARGRRKTGRYFRGIAIRAWE